MARIGPPEPHSGAWVTQVWLSFAISMAAMLIGIYYLPAEAWVKGYLFMGLFFSVASTMSLAKTLRDNHEATKVSSVLNDARVEKILAEHNPLK